MRISLKLLGVYMGVFFTLLFAIGSYVCWKAGLSNFVTFLKWSTWAPIMFIGLPVVCFLWRQKNGFYLSFLEALQFFFVAYLVYEIGYALVNIVLYDVLDKTLYSRALQFNLEQLKASLQQMNQSVVSVQSEIDQAKADPFKGVSVKQLLLGFGQNLVMDFVKSLLLGIVLKEKARPFQVPETFAEIPGAEPPVEG